MISVVLHNVYMRLREKKGKGFFEVKSAIAYIRIVNPMRDYKRIFK